MVTCKICNRQFKRINSFHLKTHDVINEKQYLKMFPDAIIIDEDAKRFISERTKKAMKDPEIRKKCAWKRTAKSNKLSSEITKKLHKDGVYKNIYNKERNKKVSTGKRIWWNKMDKDDRKELLKSWLGDYRSSENRMSNPEREYESFLILNNIEYERQYELDYKLFDFYLLNEKVLIEIDGKFWHPKSLNECEYDFQIKKYHNDIRKNKIAQKYNLELKRIRV